MRFMENQRSRQTITAGEKQIIGLLRKQNAILADIYKEIKRKNLVQVCDSEGNKKDELIVPELLPNEKTLEICHVVSNGVKFSFNNGELFESKPASPSDYYMYRNVDKGE